MIFIGILSFKSVFMLLEYYLHPVVIAICIRK